MKAGEIITYFKTIAETHVDIQHSESNKRFGRWNLIDSTGVNDLELKNKFCLILHQYEGNINGPNVDRLMNYKEISFRVVKFASSDNVAEQVSVQEKAEEICEEIIRKIIIDRAEGNININDIKFPIVFYPIRPSIDGEYGIAVEIKTGTHFTDNLNPEKWLS